MLLLIARLKKEATRLLHHGEIAGVKRVILEAKQLLASAPSTPAILKEIEAIERLDAHIRDGDTGEVLASMRSTARTELRSSKMF